MVLVRLKYTIPALFMVLLCNLSFAQAPGCPNIDAGPDENLDCTTNCVDLTASVLETGATDSYTVSSVPYAPPAPFTGGTQLFIGIDDTYSDVIDLPFNFCFYGNMYSQVVVGTNGVITFDVTEANQYCPWSFSESVPDPNLPTNAIFGAYHDIDPSVSGNINYSILGTAPCRTFVINFYEVAHFSCNNLETTQQIVIYETTNVVEVYIEDKPTCNGWNSGNALIGIQDAAGTTGVVPPGRNTGPWTANQEGWRFTPNGTSNYTVTWYDDQNNNIGTGLTVNVCPTATTTYTGEVVYDHCDGTQVTETDDITVNVANAFTVNDQFTDESCAGACDGTITVSANGGTPPYTYDIGNGPQNNGNFSNLCAGNYTIDITDGAGCTSTVDITIGSGGTIQVDEQFTDETCAGANDGTITLSASGGQSPYGYDIGFGQPNSTGSFTGLPPDTYNYTVADATGCTTTGTITIAAGPNCCPMTNTVSSTDPTCNGDCDGTITLTENNGAAPVQFSIDNGTNFQNNGNFSNLCAGTYDILIEDANGCQYTDQVTLTDPPAMAITSSSSTDADCGMCNGTIDITGSGGDGGPYQYSIDNGSTLQGSGSFTNVCPGSYDMVVQDGAGCTASGTVSVNVLNGPNLQSIDPIDATCNGLCDGTITINATGATQYSIDNGTTFQASNTFNNVCAGNYNVVIEDANGCQLTGTTTVNEPSAVTASATSTDVLCFNACDGSIDVTAGGGTSPYQYSIDNGTTFQGTGSFANACASNYDIVVEDANGCQATTTATITEPAELTVDVATTDPTCNGDCDGSATATANGGTSPYNYDWSNGDVDSQADDLCDGTYSITVTDDNGCTVTETNITITEPPAMTVDNVTTTDEVCFGDCQGTIEIESAAATSFSIDSGATFSNSNMFVDVCAGNYNIMVQDADGCEASSTADVGTIPPVKAEFVYNPHETTEIEPEIEFTNTSTGAGTYSWQFGDGTISTEENPTYDYQDGTPGTYEVCLIASNVNGCEDTSCATVFIEELFLIYVPNTFTPNNDGDNDIFIPELSGEMPGTYSLRIFNRWGEQIFTSFDKTIGWDGTFQLRKAKQDVYMWKIMVSNKYGEQKKYVGHVNLIR